MHPLTEWIQATARMFDDRATVTELLARSTLIVEIVPSTFDRAGRLIGTRGTTIEIIRQLARKIGHVSALEVVVTVLRTSPADPDRAQVVPTA